MTADELRDAINTRRKSLGLTVGRVATLAEVSDQTARDYLARGKGSTLDRALRLAAAVGLDVRVTPVSGFRVPETISRNSGNLD